MSDTCKAAKQMDSTWVTCTRPEGHEGLHTAVVLDNGYDEDGEDIYFTVEWE